MPTNAERILAYLAQHPEGATDRILHEVLGISPYQQVNHLCNRLADQGTISRTKDPANGTWTNHVPSADTSTSPPAESPSVSADRDTRPPADGPVAPNPRVPARAAAYEDLRAHVEPLRDEEAAAAFDYRRASSLTED